MEKTGGRGSTERGRGYGYSVTGILRMWFNTIENLFGGWQMMNLHSILVLFFSDFFFSFYFLILLRSLKVSEEAAMNVI